MKLVQSLILLNATTGIIFKYVALIFPIFSFGLIPNSFLSILLLYFLNGSKLGLKTVSIYLSIISFIGLIFFISDTLTFPYQYFLVGSQLCAVIMTIFWMIKEENIRIINFCLDTLIPIHLIIFFSFQLYFYSTSNSYFIAQFSSSNLIGLLTSLTLLRLFNRLYITKNIKNNKPNIFYINVGTAKIIFIIPLIFFINSFGEMRASIAINLIICIYYLFVKPTLLNPNKLSKYLLSFTLLIVLPLYITVNSLLPGYTQRIYKEQENIRILLDQVGTYNYQASQEKRDEILDLSLPIRYASVVNQTVEFIKSPLTPAKLRENKSSEANYFNRAHVVILEILKVGGIGLLIVFVTIFLKGFKYLQIINPYIKINAIGIFSLSYYLLLFNDIYIAFIFLILWDPILVKFMQNYQFNFKHNHLKI